MKKIRLFIIACLAFQCALSAQDKLKCDEDVLSILSTSTDKISSVHIVVDNENSLTLEVEVEGFTEGEYTLKGQLLSRKSTSAVIRGIDSDKVTVPSGGGTLELSFRLNQQEVRTTKNELISKFVRLMVSKSDGILSGIGDFDGLNLSGSELICACDKRWRISGKANSKVTVEVNLTPYKSANQIKQGS